MANGNLTTDQAIELFKDKSIEEQQALNYVLLHNLSEICSNRCEECDKRYIQKSWFKMKIIAISSFLLGAGVGVKELLRHLKTLTLQ